MRSLGVLQPTRKQMVPNQWQFVAGMKAADRFHEADILRWLAVPGRELNPPANRDGMRVRTKQ
jgi:hypothetical protein